jgi:outer membrane protein OmpA-like peptidoglycan-associated protein
MDGGPHRLVDARDGRRPRDRRERRGARGGGLDVGAGGHAQQTAPPVRDRKQALRPRPRRRRHHLAGAGFFDFDSSLIKDDAHHLLQTVAETVRKQNASLEIDGNCDELGTVEYNLALGEARVRAAKDYLVHLGVSSRKIETVSYGSQRPKYPGHDDDAHARNRRDDLVIR